jgi:hypothetical protein
MVYKEVLPDQCPPEGALDQPLPGVWRKVSTKDFSEQDFLSHAALGKPRSPIVSECHHASCSFFQSKDKLINVFTRLPKSRKKPLAVVKLDIPIGSGLSVRNEKTGHIDLWMFGGFSPIESVISLEEV